MAKLIPIYTWNKSVHSFNVNSDRLAKQPWFQGVLLLGCVVLAMLLANLPFTKDLYHSILHTNLQAHLSSPDGKVDLLFPRDLTIEKFINDILMVVFFFTVGLEIRREVAHGELSSPKKALLPVIAAFGGVIAPAVIFTIVNHGTAAASGWGIPTATDIAFAVCILSMLDKKVPISLKVFLTALAIADDLIAILVVALFYGGNINLPLLGVAVLVIAFTLLLRRMGEKKMFPYIFNAILVWALFYYSGIHATMSGVVMAFLIPAQSRYNRAQYIHKRNHYIALLDQMEGIDSEPFPNGPQKHCLRKLEGIAHGTMDMSYRVEHALGPWVNFLIMPIFALANAGVEISDASYFNIFSYDPALGSVSMGIFLGLLLGKPLGITLFSWLAIKFKIGAMPENANWKMFFAVACLGGIGFTMSIFVDTLSFGNQLPEVTRHLRDAGKIAVLLGSVCSGILGSVLISIVNRTPAPIHQSRECSPGRL
ncbi:MAG: Na+/H+ antiporter NhaA [Bacteroidales bacterium]|nr:Na+/H+ antiporter NhaA [Bacteroidales bacterium]